MPFKIVLDDCGKSFLDHWVFRHRSLTMESGEQIALLGPNGSGKSTFMLLAAGYLQPTEGSVTYLLNNQHVVQNQVGAHIGMCLPNMETFDDFTLEQLLTLHTSMRSMLCTSNVAALASLLQFSKSEMNRQIRFFSNGMRQRLKLGLALLTDSSAVLLDEPLTNMDEQGKSLYYGWLDTYLGTRLLLVASNRSDEYLNCTRFIQVQDWLSEPR